jgi:hypothetical protein
LGERRRLGQNAWVSLEFDGRLSSMLCPTPPAKLTDSSGRPYFLWDSDLTLEDFRSRLADADPSVRAYYLAKLMRQAKPDDVFEFTTLAKVRDLWPGIRRHLGGTRPFWEWLLSRWGLIRDDAV